MEQINVLLFYKYTKIENPESFREWHLKILNGFDLKGRVLVAEEGINGTVSCLIEATEKYKKYIHSIPEFGDIHFKETPSKNHPFRKTQVKVKKEIVASGLYNKVDVNNAGTPLEPVEFKKMIENNSDAVVLDMRNDYEFKVGRFKDAVQIGTENFREFTKKAKNFEQFKGKNILMYCTGGVRCEKASAFFRQQGFRNVYQLKGGIINFCQQFPDTLFEGSCFTFDSRLVIPVSKKSISTCEICNSDCNIYINCKNVDCDKLFVCCDGCKRNLNRCCSKNCASKIILD